MKDLAKRIDLSLKDILPDLIQLRRHFHAHPELSGQEYQTAALVAGELRKSGWEVKESVTAVNKLAPKSSLFQYKVSLPEIGSTIVYASNPAELRQKLRLLINYRYRGDITIERILPGDAGKFFMDKRQKHLKNVKEQADQAIKQQMTRQQIGLEKKKSSDKIKQIRMELQKKTASLMKKQRAGGAQATVDK